MTKAEDSHLKEIFHSYSKKMNKKAQFYHILDEISKHILKLKKLKKYEDKPGHLKEEICDIYILGKLLFKLEKVNISTFNKALTHFVNKVHKIYTK